MNAIELIKAERERQVSAHGWTPEHDDEHTGGELADAAASYAEYTARLIVHDLFTPVRPSDRRPPTNWPWTEGCWKPADDPVRNLVKAGALIVAEIERIQRIGAEAPAPEESNSDSTKPVE